MRQGRILGRHFGLQVLHVLFHCLNNSAEVALSLLELCLVGSDGAIQTLHFGVLGLEALLRSLSNVFARARRCVELGLQVHQLVVTRGRCFGQLRLQLARLLFAILL